MWQTPFVEEIVNKLVFLLNISNLVFDIRLTALVNLLPLLPHDRAVQIAQEVALTYFQISSI